MRIHTILVTGLLFGAIAKLQPFEPVVVVGRSMEPTLHDRQIVLASKNIESISRGDVIVFKMDGDTLIKRVAYLPGDQYTVYKNGPMWLTPANASEERNFKCAMPETRVRTVPPGKIFVIGDNYLEASDSREFGPVDIQTVIAKIIHADGSAEVFNGVRLSHSMATRQDEAHSEAGVSAPNPT